MNRSKSLLLILMLLVMGGCATVPTGPSVMVLPAPGKPFDLFQAEDARCKLWAGQQVGLTPQQAINQNMASGAAVGTLMGAGLGAAIGAVSGNPGAGAAIGAGSGLFGGALSGAGSGQAYGWEAQRRYDMAYQQCMYSMGNQVPGAVQRTQKTYYMPPPPPEEQPGL